MRMANGKLPAQECPVSRDFSEFQRGLSQAATRELKVTTFMIKRLFFVVLVTLASPLAGAQTAAAGSDLVSVRPNAGGAPEEIVVRLGVIDIVGVNDREKEFTADLFIEIAWRDPRLALSDADADSLRTFAMTDVWTPRLTVVNDRGLDSLLQEVVNVDRNGNVVGRLRLAGPLAVDLALHDFPFDTQTLPVEIVSYRYTPSEIVFSEDSELIARLDEMSGDGWHFSALEPEPFVYRLRDNGVGAAGLRFAIEAERDSTYYLFTLALPMTLILFLGWMVHWIPVQLVPPRMGTASATVFSLIALGVSYRLTLPKITYLTIADRFSLFATLLVLISLAVTVLTIRWASTDRLDAAQRLAGQARVAFPILFGLVVLLTFLT